MDEKKSVKQLVFGVAFNPMFKLLDCWGEIADDILYHNKYFSADFFSQISWQYSPERRLFNPDTGHSFVLTASNLVFTQTISNDFGFELSLFNDRVQNYIVPFILSQHILVVRRLGMVYIASLNQDEIKQFTSQYFLPKIENIMDFRFSVKQSTIKGGLISDNSDFINKIFTVGNISDTVTGVSFDYQLHFKPPKEDVREDIAKFLKDSHTSFINDILNNLGDKK